MVKWQGRRSSTASGLSTGGSGVSLDRAPSSTDGRTPVTAPADGRSYNCVTTGRCGDAGAAPASWGVVCLAVFIQRASDKSAAVRGKALGHLATVVAEALKDASAEGPPFAFRRVRISSRCTLRQRLGIKLYTCLAMQMDNHPEVALPCGCTTCDGVVRKT